MQSILVNNATFSSQPLCFEPIKVCLIEKCNAHIITSKYGIHNKWFRKKFSNLWQEKWTIRIWWVKGWCPRTQRKRCHKVPHMFYCVMDGLVNESNTKLSIPTIDLKGIHDDHALRDEVLRKVEMHVIKLYYDTRDLTRKVVYLSNFTLYQDTYLVIGGTHLHFFEHLILLKMKNYQ